MNHGSCIILLRSKYLSWNRCILRSNSYILLLWYWESVDCEHQGHGDSLKCLWWITPPPQKKQTNKQKIAQNNNNKKNEYYAIKKPTHILRQKTWQRIICLIRGTRGTSLYRHCNCYNTKDFLVEYQQIRMRIP